MSRLHDWLKNIDKKENAKLIWIKIGKLIILDCIAWVATRGYPNSLLKQKQDKHAAKAFFLSDRHYMVKFQMQELSWLSCVVKISCLTFFNMFWVELTFFLSFFLIGLRNRCFFFSVLKVREQHWRLKSFKPDIFVTNSLLGLIFVAMLQ